MFAVLQPAGALRDIFKLSALEFRNDVIDGLCLALDRSLAGGASQTAVPCAGALVVIKRHRRNLFALNVFPNMQLRPIEQWMDANMRAGREIGLKLVPKFRGLVAHIPKVIFIARGEITLFGPAAFLIGSGADDHAMIGFFIGVGLIFSGLEVQFFARPSPI